MGDVVIGDVLAFIRARLDEDERAARGAKPGPWEYDSDLDDPDPYEDYVYSVHDGDHGDLVGDPVCFTRGKETVGNGVHIARQNPARVLLGIWSKRLLLEGHEPYESYVDWSEFGAPIKGHRCLKCRSSRSRAEGERWPCRDVRLLATEHAAHPDYREEWKP